MAKQKKNLAKFTRSGFGRTNLAQELQRLEGLIRKEKWPESMRLLSTLTQQFPQSKRVWEKLAYVSVQITDLSNYQRAMENLTALDPTHADHFFGLGAVCITNVYPLMALQAFRQGIALDPNHELADQARSTLTTLEPMLQEALADMFLSEADGLEIAVLHERGQARLERGDYELSKVDTLAVMERHPSFLPAQNNLSLIFWAEGDVEAAMAQAQTVLDQQPDNIHALANLVRFHVLTQRPDAARSYADRLRASHASAWDGWTKKAEALTLLADDQSLVTLFDEFLAQGGDALEQDPEHGDPRNVAPDEDTEAAPIPRPSMMFYHLVAVALARTGELTRAKDLWKKVLDHDPHFELAKTNLTDLRLPLGQRHGAWPLSWEQWLIPSTLKAFRQMMEQATDRRGQRLISEMSQFFADHPDFVAMLPRMAERGGPRGQEFLLLAAQQIDHPDLLAALKEFALGQNGPDDLRYRAAVRASQAQIIDKNNVTLWRNGAWETITLMDFEIHGEVVYDHGKRVGQWLTQALKLLRTQTPAAAEQAEELLNQAIAVEPDSPDLYNNLAAAYYVQGRNQEAEALVVEVHQRFPDYVMAAMAQVRLHMLEGDLEAAEAILKSFMARGRFHVEEFSVFCETYADLWLAKGMPDGARIWLQTWEQATPDHPRLKLGWAKLDSYIAKET